MAFDRLLTLCVNDGVEQHESQEQDRIRDAAAGSAASALRAGHGSPAGGPVLAVTMPDISFFDYCMDVLIRQAAEAGLTVLRREVASSDEALRSDLAQLPCPAKVVVFRNLLEPFARHLQQQRHRVVIVGMPRDDAVPATPYVYGDHHHGGRIVMEHLIELGHQHVWLYPEEGFDHSPRAAGIRQAMRPLARLGRDVRVTPVRLNELSTWQQAPERVAGLVRAPGGPTALMAWNDVFAEEAAQVLGRAGLAIPGDISLVGYDNMPRSSATRPPLTTVDHAVPLQIRAALDLVTRPLPPPPTHSVRLLPFLVRRESTGPAPRR